MTYMKISQCKQYGGQRKCNFKRGDNVLVKSFFKNGTKYTWKRGTIENKVGSRMYIVNITDLKIKVKKHVDQLLHYKGCDDTNESDSEGDVPTLQNDDDAQDDNVEDAQTDAPLPEEQEAVELAEGGVANPHDTSPDTSFESVVSSVSSPQRQSVQENTDTIMSSDCPLEVMEADDNGVEPDAPAESHGLVDLDNRRQRPIRSTRNKDVNYKI
ncbi:uncharacterized protein LOC134668580 [Cydia fagiglandana]|uniref:uncharacterized protein LOC134668580 n=1 Tax=Cydia fagiglandana TaxID=1458189 RepID=UPI002FEDEE9B